MQSNPIFLIEDFTETLSTIFKNFSEICKAHVEKMKEARPEYSRVENDIAKERKRRIQLQNLVKQRLTQSNEGSDGNPKRPKTGFHVYMLQVQNSIMREHPSFNNHKVGTIALIKWKHMTREQQTIYERRAEEMNKISDEEYFRSIKSKPANDACYIKREYNHDEDYQNNKENEETPNPEPPKQSNQNSNQATEGLNREPNIEGQGQEKRVIEEEAHRESTFQSTMMMENEYDHQPTVQMDEPVENPSANANPSEDTVKQQPTDS